LSVESGKGEADVAFIIPSRAVTASSMLYKWLGCVIRIGGTTVFRWEERSKNLRILRYELALLAKIHKHAQVIPRSSALDFSIALMAMSCYNVNTTLVCDKWAGKYLNVGRKATWLR
jgi:hypothetical protein